MLLQTQNGIKLDQIQSNSIKCKMKSKLFEEWKTNWDNNFVVGAVLMDLSEAFNCMPHESF